MSRRRARSRCWSESVSKFHLHYAWRQRWLPPRFQDQSQKMPRAIAGFTALLIAAFLASPASAQDPRRAEISGGYQWLTAKVASEDGWRTFPKGWYVDVAGHVTPLLSIVSQVSGNYRTFEDEDFDFALHTFMAGVRATSPGRVSGHGQFLAGIASLKASDDADNDSESDVAVQFGAGVTVPVSGRVGLRV